MPSFDVVSEVEMAEVLNAVDQASKEINTRYDFKGSKSSVKLNDSLIDILADDEMKLRSVQEILREKLAKRGIDLKCVVFEASSRASGNLIKQQVSIKQGLESDELKKLNKLLKSSKLKVSGQVQGNQLRVTGKKRDDLQSAMALFKEQATELALQFNNFRD